MTARCAFHQPSGQRELREVRSAGDTRVTVELERCAACGTWATPGHPYFATGRCEWPLWGVACTLPAGHDGAHGVDLGRL